MGIYDRDYHRSGNYDREPGFYLGALRMMTTNIILITCALFVVQKVAGPWYENAFALHANWYRQPWKAYQLLTYGFLHAPDDLWHIVLNMLGLFFFGREVELRYGRREYLAVLPDRDCRCRAGVDAGRDSQQSARRRCSARPAA